MQCPRCGSKESAVKDSRETTDAVRRRRQCKQCGNRFWTYERVETAKPRVVKRDGTREEWNRAKLLEGVRLAFAKRPVSSSRIEELVDDVEAEMTTRGDQEVESSEVGNAVMRRLLALDEVAYIRFASVYRRFRDVAGFMEEVEKLKRPSRPSDEQIRLDI